MSWFRRFEQSHPDGESTALLEDLAHLDHVSQSIDSIRAKVIERFVDYARADSGLLFDRRDPSGRHHLTGSPELRLDASDARRPQPSDKLCRWLTANEQCLHVRDDRAVTSYLPPDDHTLFRLSSTRLVVPLISSSRLPGLLLLASSNSDWQAAPAVRATLCAAGRIAAASLERAHARDAEQERLEALHRAQQLTVAGRLAAEVAHEVRNPLAAIRLTIQAILDGQFDGANASAMLTRTLGEVDRIQETVSRLLNLSRPEQLDLRDVNLAEIAGAAVDLVRPLAGRGGIKLETDLSQPLLVRADRAEMQKVFLNLLMNACQAMSGGGVLRVSARVFTGPERQVSGAVSVADSGSGVSQDWLDKAFVPFFTTKRTGTGLGLPVSLDIVTRHGGRLELSNGNPTGTVATVSLPLRNEQDIHA